MSDLLVWLQEYYLSLCDGEWEHGIGFEIGTLDNPGWGVDLNLEDTPMESQPFDTVDNVHRSEHDWVHCKIEGKVFKGRGGPRNLVEILTIFRDWVEKARAAS